MTYRVEPVVLPHPAACAGALALALLAATAPGAGAQTAGPLVQITKGDPVAGCIADKPQGQEQKFGSTVYFGTAIEPWVTVDPSNPLRLLSAHQQDRWDDGGARALTGNVSLDGGKTWSVTVPSGVTVCTGGKWLRASDPWVSFAPDGTAYFFSLTLNPDPTTPFGASASAMLVSRSTNHGQSWSKPTTLIEDDTPLALNDKNSLTADPTDARFAYAVWDRLQLSGPVAAAIAAGEMPAPSARPAFIGDGVARARDRLKRGPAGALPTDPSRGPTWFARTTDNGVSWQRPQVIYDPGVNAQTINNQVVVPPNGNVLVFFTNISAAGALDIGLVQSADKGFSFSTTPVFASDIRVVTVVTPDSQEPLRDAAILYSVAADPVSGALYLAWQDCRFGPNFCLSGTPVDGIAFSQSLDGGATWSKPVRINQTPQNLSNPLRSQAFIPAIAVASDGTIGVTYYDFRNDVSTPGVEGADDWIVFCTPAAGDCSKPAHWGHEVRLTPAPFNMLDAPVARGHFLGDYMGLAANGLNFWPVFGIAAAPNRTADFTRKITLPGPVLSAE